MGWDEMVCLEKGAEEEGGGGGGRRRKKRPRYLLRIGNGKEKERQVKCHDGWENHWFSDRYRSFWKRIYPRYKNSKMRKKKETRFQTICTDNIGSVVVVVVVVVLVVYIVKLFLPTNRSARDGDNSFCSRKWVSEACYSDHVWIFFGYGGYIYHQIRKDFTHLPQI